MTDSSRRLAFVFDQRFCIGCRACQIACKDLHDLPVGVNWRRVLVHESGRFPNPQVTYLSVTCRHCARPACLDACPAGAIAKRPEDGAVTLDASLCVGCGCCVDACPYEAIQIDPSSGLAGKCDLCVGLRERGEQPACVSSCPMRALHVRWQED